MRSPEVPDKCKEDCPFAGQDLGRARLFPTKNCAGVKVATGDAPELIDRVDLSTTGEATLRKDEGVRNPGQIVCRNVGIALCIEDQLPPEDRELGNSTRAEIGIE